MLDVLKTREGFFSVLAVAVQLAKMFVPDSYHQLVDYATTGAATIAANRIYKKAVTPGMAPFQPVPPPAVETANP